MTQPTAIQQPLTDGQAALVEAARLRIAAQRLRMIEKREAGKLRGTAA